LNSLKGLQFIWICTQHLPKELDRFARFMLMLHALQRIPFVSQGPELGDIAAGKHVAVHEDRPTLVAHQPGDQETAEGECGELLGVTGAPITTPPAFPAEE